MYHKCGLTLGISELKAINCLVHYHSKVWSHLVFLFERNEYFKWHLNFKCSCNNYNYNDSNKYLDFKKFKYEKIKNSTVII